MSNLIFAQADSAGGGGGASSLIFLGLMVVVFWLFIIRPQRSRVRNQQQLAASIQVGDRVQTIGGIHGVVRSLDDTSAVLEVEQGRIRVARRAIASRETKET
jgi:preprotein translocase subunit YajC